jgi:hypothetical protein
VALRGPPSSIGPYAGMDAHNFFLDGKHVIRLGEGAEMRCLGVLEHLRPVGATGRSRAAPPLGGEGRPPARGAMGTGAGRRLGPTKKKRIDFFSLTNGNAGK